MIFCCFRNFLIMFVISKDDKVLNQLYIRKKPTKKKHKKWLCNVVLEIFFNLEVSRLDCWRDFVFVCIVNQLITKFEQYEKRNFKKILDIKNVNDIQNKFKFVSARIVLLHYESVFNKRKRNYNIFQSKIK